MKRIKLGDLYSLKNHPYGNGLTKVKISALAQMSPPILVVSEILNSPKEYDQETGKEKNKQIKCIFYSHKTHKFENHWFDIKILKEIYELQYKNGESIEEFEEIQTKNKIEIDYPKSYSLEDIREKFLHNQVILKSCDLELGKLKTTFSQTDQKSVDKINAHLDFLPPVLTVIDVKLNDEKIGFNPKSGNLKKIASAFLLKCKWYNSLSSSFSEDFLPIETIEIIKSENSIAELVSRLILTKEFIKQDLEQPIKLESGIKLKHIYAQPVELIFNHYKYKLKYYDFFRSKTLEMNLSDYKTDDDSAKLEDIVLRKIPDYDSNLQKFNTVNDFIFEEKTFYKITYKDAKDKVTDRIIYVKKFIPRIIIIADCLLRNGYERHFRVSESSILKVEILEQKYFK